MNKNKLKTKLYPIYSIFLQKNKVNHEYFMFDEYFEQMRF